MKASQKEKPPQSFECILVVKWMVLSPGIWELLYFKKKMNLKKELGEGFGFAQISDFFCQNHWLVQTCGQEGVLGMQEHIKKQLFDLF